MIVIVIIGLVYTLAISKLQNVAQESQTPSFKNLKEYLHSYISGDAKSATLLCFDDCSECSIYVDGEEIEKIESFFDESVSLYRYDSFEGVVPLEAKPFFNDDGVEESLCFSFEVDKNLISEQVIVVYKNRVYDYTSYFEGSRVYDSLSAFVEAKESRVYEVLK